ncbi:transcriptional regulator [Leptolyngbya sp. Heron Island J]|uniref:TetR/AcrR family transcriptional regulator n=1 Tax=Leptolyngbya sp. Heron Island J TaxID=1385935 RepID=UPI0003B9E05A|nr:TetR/AcrR family transcriptional regulator [Leptolyngbya sp. Heron Island J]ESA33489.1 transcriptional regulator [Leptolyngbya sp. Heron Island J]
MTPTVPSANSDPKVDKANAILAGAFEVFTSQGFAAASMARIAKAAGVSKPTLYSYFQDKEGLFIAVVQQLLHKSNHMALSLPVVAEMPPSPEAPLRAMATSFLSEAASNKPFLTLMRLIIGESEQFPELAQTFVRVLTKPFLEKLTAYLANHPQLEFADPEVAARTFAGAMVHYLIVQEMLGGKNMMPLECDRMVDGLIDLMMAGGHYQAESTQ